jgi:hypothetical protein
MRNARFAIGSLIQMIRPSTPPDSAHCTDIATDVAQSWRTLPTLTELCRALGDDLSPVAGVTLPERTVTGVHISELMDPTPI